MGKVRPDSAQTCRLLDEVRGGQPKALGHLLERCRDELVAFVEVRLDTKLRGRIDPSDVVQETQLELARRMDDFLQRRPMPFHLWVRKTACQRLMQMHRDHRRQRRAVGREVPLPDRSSLLLARPLVGAAPTPSQHLAAREFSQRISQAVSELSEWEREILLMRHAEDLQYEEIAFLLDIEPAAARKRYGRALIRLRGLLKEHQLLGDAP